MGIFSKVLHVKNGLLAGLKIPKIAPESKKRDFPKVWDNDTPIQPGKKEGQTDVSSAPKMFYDHYRGFWENLKFRFSITTLTTLLGFLYRNGQAELKKLKNEIFSKTALVVVKPF